MMNHARSTCITLALLLVAVALTYAGYSLVRDADAGNPPASGRANPGASPTSVVATESQHVGAATSAAAPSISSTEAQALDAQLQAIENELESLRVPEDSGDGAKDEGRP